MSSIADDPRLTAYALGELPEAERAEVEALLRDDPAARAALEETASLAGLLKEELRAEPGPRLSPDQRAAVVQRFEDERRIVPFYRRRAALWTAGGALAASLLGYLTFGTELTERRRPEALARLGSQSKMRDAGAPYRRVEPLTGAPRSEDFKSAPPPAAPSRPEESNAAPAPILGLPALKRKSEARGALKPDVRFSTSLPPAEDQVQLGLRGKLKESIELSRSSSPRSREPAVKPELRRFNPSPQDPSVDVPTLPERRQEALVHNPFRSAIDDPLSTFSIDVDTASYANVRRFLTHNTRPPLEQVRIEEMINYFSYDYAPPVEADRPFSSELEVTQCPWNIKNRLVRIGLKGRVVPEDQRPTTNLVFLLDVSGSMNSANKLPLVKEGLRQLVERLGENDRVAIVVYAGASGLVLPSTSCQEKSTILGALDRLSAGGSTNGGAGIQLAYQTAVANFIEGGVNRVVLATDGDFNVGLRRRSDLESLIQDRAKSGVFLTVLGFGRNGYNDGIMETLADKGNGNYAFIDNRAEAKKVLVDQLSGTLITIAKDVKIQVEFNPAKVASYRLIGYENRVMAAADFNDDRKDAGEIGAGHTVTALYEVVLRDPNAPLQTEDPRVDELKYQERKKLSQSPEMLTLKLRYKQPDGDTSSLLAFPLVDQQRSYNDATTDFKFAASVALFGMILRNSPHKGDGNLELVDELAQDGLGADAKGYRKEFRQLVQAAHRFVR